MTPTQVAGLYYARKNAAKATTGQEKIMPDLTLLQEKWQMTRPQGSMPRERKLACSKQGVRYFYHKVMSCVYGVLTAGSM